MGSVQQQALSWNGLHALFCPVLRQLSPGQHYPHPLQDEGTQMTLAYKPDMPVVSCYHIILATLPRA